MSERKFTPGEWECDTFLPETYRIHPKGNPSYRTKSPDEFFANARLIASAPLLYEACRNLMELFDGYGKLSEKYQDQLSVALEKGESALRAAERR